MQQRVFVTGGSGLIGRPLIRLLIRKGYEVHALTHSKNGQKVLEEMGANVINGDLKHYDSFARQVPKCEAVFHLGGSPSFRFVDRSEIKQVHVQGTQNVIRLVEQLKVPHFIFCSSVGIYSFNSLGIPDVPITSVYEHAKWAAHHEVEMFSKHYPGVSMVLPAYVMGPGGQDILGAYMRAFRLGRLPFVIRLEQPMSYVFVNDVADALWLCLTKGKDGGQYILSSEDCTPMQLIDYMEELSGRKRPRMILNPVFAKPFLFIDELLATLTGRHPFMTNELMNILRARPWVFSSELARKELGWNPIGIKEMITETFKSFN